MEVPQTIPELLKRRAADFPECEAVAMAGRALTYAQLDAETRRVAQGLIAAGAGKGTRIALMAPDGIFWLVAFLGALRIGALVAAVSTLCKPPELAHILRNCDAQIFIGARRFLQHDYAAVLEAALPGLQACAAGNLRLGAAPFLRAIYLDDVEDLNWAAGFEELYDPARAAGEGGAEFFEALEAEVAGADLALILYTSGSTSAPKAVLHLQATLMRKSAELAEYFRIAPGDRMLPTLPVFWVGGLAMALMVLIKGGTLVYPAAPDTGALIDAIAALGVTRVNSWGPKHRKLVQAAMARGIDIDRIGGLGAPRDAQGAVIPPELFPNLLGMSESFSAHSGEWMDRALPADKAGSAGRAIGDIERRVVDPETGAILGPDQVGELQIRGTNMLAGFYKLPPWRVFTPDGFYPTGDLVRIDAEDYLFFVARRGDFIKTSGANVSRLEVEQALLAIPGIALAIVLGFPDAELGERIAAAVVPEGDAALDEGPLRAKLAAVLSSYKVPRRIFPITADEVAWTATGTKIDLKKMREKLAFLLGAEGRC